jgi:putative endonuclease
MKVYYVYIIKCSDETYYTGFTSNLAKRMIENNTGKHKDSYTFNRKPMTLEFYAEFTNVNIAIETEKQIKKWSKAKKRALINGEFEKLPNLSKKKFGK